MFSDDKHNPLGRFDGLASVYAKYRPGYPSRAIDWIVEKLDGSRLPIADIGAGTGILTRQLAERGCRVIGIEPNESMRSQAAAAPKSDLIEYRAGRGESTGLESNSVAGVVAAQTFHWCDPDPSLREFHRILRLGGWTTLMWNASELSDPFTAGFWRLLRENTPEPEIVEKPHHLAGQVLLDHPLFEDADMRVVGNVQDLDEDGLLGRAFSASFAPKECGASERFAQRLRELFQQYEQGGYVHLLYQTTVYQARSKN